VFAGHGRISSLVIFSKEGEVRSPQHVLSPAGPLSGHFPGLSGV
jgi:hypothetical protein